MSSGIDVAALGPVAVAARAFRARGRAFVTAIVKVTLSLSQDAAMQIAKPAPIVWREELRTDRPLASVRRPSDVALLVPQPEIIVDAIAFAGATPQTRLTTRVALARGTTMLMSKHLEIFGDRRVAPKAAPPGPAAFERMPIVYERAFGGLGRSENPAGTGIELGTDGKAALPNVMAGEGTKVDPPGYGAISSGWPLRRQRRGAHRSDIDDAAFVDLEASFDDGYFQASPLDQRVDELRAGDMVVMTNLHPEYKTLRAHVPDLRGLALVELRGGESRPIALRPDLLFIEPHMMRAELTFRGALGVAAQDLERVRISGAIEEAGERFDWALARGGGAGRASEGRTLTLDAAPPAQRVALEGTLVMEPGSPAKAPATPFAKSGAPARAPEVGLGGTLVMEPKGGAPRATPEVRSTLEVEGGEGPRSLPFAKKPKRSRTSASMKAVREESVPGAPWSPKRADDARPARRDMSSTLVIEEPRAAEAAPPATVSPSTRPRPKKSDAAMRAAKTEPPPVEAKRALEPPPVQPPAVEVGPPVKRKAAWREDAVPDRPAAPQAREAPPASEKKDMRSPIYKKFKR